MARAEDQKRSSEQFVEGEAAYQRLARAKELDQLVNTNNTALGSGSQVELKKVMYDSYMREIIENGGAPSMDEIKQKVDLLGVYAIYEESLLVNATNSIT